MRRLVVVLKVSAVMPATLMTLTGSAAAGPGKPVKGNSVATKECSKEGPCIHSVTTANGRHTLAIVDEGS